MKNKIVAVVVLAGLAACISGTVSKCSGWSNDEVRDECWKDASTQMQAAIDATPAHDYFEMDWAGLRTVKVKGGFEVTTTAYYWRSTWDKVGLTGNPSVKGTMTCRATLDGNHLTTYVDLPW